MPKFTIKETTLSDNSMVYDVYVQVDSGPPLLFYCAPTVADARIAEELLNRIDDLLATSKSTAEFRRVALNIIAEILTR